MTDDPRQIDWISLEDKMASQRQLLASCADDVGIENLAHWLKQDPSTLRNQLARRDRKTPSADLEHLVYIVCARYRSGKAALLGEELRRPADLTPEEAMREATVAAQAKGYIDAADLAAIYARMRTR